MNAIAKFFGFGGGNNVHERSVVPIDNSIDISNENLHHHYKELFLPDIDEDLVYDNSYSMNENYDNNNFSEAYEYDESPMGYNMDQNNYDNDYYRDINNGINDNNMSIDQNNYGYYSDLSIDDDNEQVKEVHQYESEKRKRSSSRNNAISEDTIVESVSKSKKKKMKAINRAQDLLLANKGLAQKDKAYNTITDVAAIAQVPIKDVKNLKKSIKGNEGKRIEVNLDSVPDSSDDDDVEEWDQEKNDHAVRMLIANNMNQSQRSKDYLSLSAIESSTNVTRAILRKYLKVLQDNNGEFFTPAPPRVGRKGSSIITADVKSIIDNDPRIKPGCSDETATRVIWDALKKVARDNNQNPHAVPEPVYDDKLKQEMERNGYKTNLKAKAKTKERQTAAGDFLSRVAAAAVYFITAYEVPVQGKEPLKPYVRIRSPNMILNADATTVLFGHSDINDKFSITISKERLKNLEDTGLSGVYDRSTDSLNTQRRSIGMYPNVSLSGYLVVNVYWVTESTIEDIEIICLQEDVPEATYFAVRPPNSVIPESAFMAKIHQDCIFPSIAKWRDHCIAREFAEIERQFKEGHIDDLEVTKKKEICIASHMHAQMTADGCYAQVEMLNMEKIISYVKQHNIINQKWSAGCSLFQNALDKAKSFMLFKYIMKQIKNSGFHAWEVASGWFDRLKSFTAKHFNLSSAKTLNVFFSHVENMQQSIFRKSIVQEGFKFTGFGNEFDLDIIFGQWIDYGDITEDQRNEIHRLFWEVVVPKAYEDNTLSHEFLWNTYMNVLDLEDFDIFNSKDKRPLNGQYSLILNPETIKLVAERKASVLKLIEDKRIEMKKIENEEKKKLKNDAKEVQSKLLEPTKTKEKNEIAELRKIAKDAIKKIDDGNKNIKLQLQSKKDKAALKKAIDDNNINIESLKKNIRDKLSLDISEVKRLAKIECGLILTANNNPILDDEENNEMNNNDEANNFDDDDNLNAYNDV